MTKFPPHDASRIDVRSASGPLPFATDDAADTTADAVRLVAEAAVVACARQVYDLRERRYALLGKGLFLDPAWDILLDLFLSASDGRQLSVSAVCIGSRSSPATGLRYIALLGEAGLVDRIADATDGRRSHVALTTRGWNAMVVLLRGSPVLP